MHRAHDKLKLVRTANQDKHECSLPPKRPVAKPPVVTAILDGPSFE